MITLLFSVFFLSSPVFAGPKEDCGNNGGYWDGNSCVGGSPQTRCEAAGGKWENSSCDTKEINSTRQLTCLGSGGVWHNGSCREAGGVTVTGTIKNVINTLLFIIGIAAVIIIIIAGFRMVMANGDSQSVARARSSIIYAVIGLIVAVSAYAIVNFILDQLG